MRKIIFNSLLIFLFTIGSFAQENINQVNAKGDRIGVWEKHYQNQRIRYQGQFENGKEVGVFKYYSAASSEFPIVIKTFNKYSSEALVQYYTLKGLPESEGKINGKERIGEWIYYHKDGTTQMLEENYIDGVLNGVFKIFYENGKLTKLVHFKDGKLHGNSKKYSHKSILIEDVNYVNGELHGYASFYEDNGNLKQKGLYEEDLKVGVWEFFEDGELSESKEVKVWKEKE